MDFKNLYSGQKSLSFLLSLLLHLFVLVIFAFIRFGDFLVVLPEYSIISFSESPEEKQTERHRLKEKPIVKKSIRKEKEYPADKTVTEIDQEMGDKLLTDSVSVKEDTSQTYLIVIDSSDQYLKYAQSLLDTFLVRNPEYAKLILNEQAKGLAKKKFGKESLVKKLNEEIHKYIQKNYPEGSRHAINQYTGPGIQIPIDKLINLVLKIFD